MSSARAAATEYRQNGWNPIPVKAGSKATSLSELAPYLERRATAEELRGWTWAGVGVVTGPVSGVLVLDVDGPEGEAELNNHGHPATPMVRTPSGGLHLYFKHPAGDVRTGIRVAPGLDVKARGGYVVAPPTRGANGKAYEWIVSPQEAELAEIPDWLRGILEDRGRRGPAAPVEEKIPKGQRHSTLVSLAGSMRRRGMDAEEIFAALSVANERRCEPPMETSAIRKMADSVAELYEPVAEVVPISANGHGSALPPARFNLTDLGNAERFVYRHGEDVRFCYPWGKWLVWTGKRWERDESGRVFKLAKDTVRGIYGEAAAAEDEDRRKALAKHAAGSESEAKIRAMLELAKSEVPASPDDLDAAPWLLNAPNGTVDLRTGELREHRREDLITKMAGAEYRPGTEAPTWAAFLERALPGEDLQGFVRRAAGYSATGDTSEQCMLINHGSGANGKSTFHEALAAALGDYAMRTPTEMLMSKRGGGVPNDVARLKGARFVSASETEEGRRLAESLIKDLTGQDTISARFMRGEFFDFRPTHKLWLSTNHKPEIRGTDNAIWRRIRLVPWAVSIPPAEQDRKLPEKLRAESAGVLAWIVDGCLEWRRGGLQAPDEVRRATGAYRSEMDVIGAFLRDECEIGRDFKATLKAVYARYEEWCEEGGERAESKRKFNARLTERGQFADRRSGPGGLREWHGLRLLTKENSGFAGKLTERSEKTHNGGASFSRSVNGENSVSSSATSVTGAQQARIEKLVRRGFSEGSAWAEVLAADHSVGCDCEGCL